MITGLGHPFLAGCAAYCIPRLDEWYESRSARVQALFSAVQVTLSAIKSGLVFFIGERAWHLIAVGCKNAWLPLFCLTYALQYTTACSVYLAAIIVLAGSMTLYCLQEIVAAWTQPEAPMPTPSVSQELQYAAHCLDSVTRQLKQTENSHPDEILKQHREKLLAAVDPLSMQELADPRLVSCRNALLGACIERLQHASRGAQTAIMEVSLSMNALKEQGSYTLPSFGARNRSATFKKTHALIVKWFKRFSNPNQIFNTVARENLETMLINGKTLHHAIKEHKKIARVCKDVSFLKYAKIALLAQAVAESFPSGTEASKKKRAAELMSLCPIDYNPVAEFPQTFASLFPRLFRNEVEYTPTLTNAVAAAQPQVRFRFETVKALQLEIRSNFVISQFQGGEQRELLQFAQTALLSKPARARTFRGYCTVGQPLN